MTCTAAVRRPDLRQCKRRATHGSFCAEHFELHERWHVLEGYLIPVWDWPQCPLRVFVWTFSVCGSRWVP